MKLFQNLTSGFREGDFLRISSCPYGKRSPYALEPCLMTIRISITIFETGYSRNISVKLVQNLTSCFREEDSFKKFHVCRVQKAPVHQRHFYRGIKLSPALFEKGHPRNIPAKFGSNWLSSLGEDV